MPKYKDISDEIRLRIRNGIYNSPTNQIPDEITLCKEFHCSRMTMKKALDLLVFDGIIYRKRGHGSFIMDVLPVDSRINISDRDLKGLTRLVNNNVKTEIIEFKLIFADYNISTKLNINENSPIYEIIRLRLINNEPVVIENTYLDATLITGLNKDILKKSIYDFIENDLDLKISSANKVIRADKSTDIDKRYLNLCANDPILEVEQIAYLNNGRAFEYSISRHRYDKFQFTSFSVRM
ncbi:GntR family transcriptional regulator [Clostridium sartagoforme AAU1]|uniref:GntR family transcriptional regulator n=1 Tax=Clostridium sartagoforme AAU1 TaxID=1202534 RepID=R9CFV9_9CLOT|nr:GntR family transcriptional regulator [Clostridium sartagoforme]EOR28173.1 GntR family transcriptional regulator [Clostridium sartagoforme AAU1]